MVMAHDPVTAAPFLRQLVADIAKDCAPTTMSVGTAMSPQRPGLDECRGGVLPAGGRFVV